MGAKITIVCVGKVKEKFYRDAIAEYQKRLSRYCSLSIAEVADEKTPDGASEAVEEQIKNTEGDRILKKISDKDYVIALDIQGKQAGSEELAYHLEDLTGHGTSSFVFVIGGSLGLSKAVLKRSNERLSFSPMTFPHQLMRVILLEQLYRCYRIINHEPYHK